MSDRLTRALPDLWDWEPVQWDAWRDTRTTLILHVPAEHMACDKCGTVDENLVVFGKRPRRPDLGQEFAVRDLHAFRCRHCGHDTVTDQRTGEHWDLDETDYGPAGSTRPELAHTTDITEPTTLF